MAYDIEIEERIERVISTWGGTEKKRMFGGICYLLGGKMFCGVYRDYLILRLGKKGAEEALRSEFVRPLDITGRPMRGWVMVKKEGIGGDEELFEWLNEAREFVETLPD